MRDVLSGPFKKCMEDALDEDTIAIAHDDELQLIDLDDAVSPSPHQFIPGANKVMRASRKL